MKKSDIQYWVIIVCIVASMVTISYFEGTLQALGKATISAGLGILFMLMVGNELRTYLKARRGG